MLIHFVGGMQCGLVVDADLDPWCHMLALQPPVAETLRAATELGGASHRTVYRLQRATPDEAWYHLDPDLTRAARDATAHQWLSGAFEHGP